MKKWLDLVLAVLWLGVSVLDFISGYHWSVLMVTGAAALIFFVRFFYDFYHDE